MKRKLTATHMRIIRLIKDGRNPESDFIGKSQLGGFYRSIGSLVGLVSKRNEEPGWELTADGDRVFIENERRKANRIPISDNRRESLRLQAARLRSTSTYGKFGNEHGMTRTAEYQAWVSMRSRCYRKSYHLYRRYGGRGIVVCEQWLNSFEDFYADMGNRPSSRHSLDRINNDGNYEPGNCRWATTLEQGRNKSLCRVIEWNGRRQTLTEWAMDLGISPSSLSRRLRTWPISNALTKPARTLRARKWWSPSALSVEQVLDIKQRLSSGAHPRDLAAFFGVRNNVIYRIRNGTTFSEVLEAQ